MLPLIAQTCNYRILKEDINIQNELYPLFRSEYGEKKIWVVSPQHGRSYVVGKLKNRWILSKGNGLSYTTDSIVKTAEQDFEIWGILRLKDALRDFNLGNEIASLGIKTNIMEAILELDYPIQIKNQIIKPVLLQYSVECPYRISDAPFISRRIINKYIKNWKTIDKWHSDVFYKIVANILISNLRILHDNKILHNALTSQNLTWALELLDFELASSPQYPYETEDYKRHVPDLFNREIIYTYQIILDIAWILKEKPDYEYLDSLFKDYGFDFQKEFEICLR